MSAWICTVNCLNAANVATVLRFADTTYIDDAANRFDGRMIQPAIVKVAASDGGNFKFFSTASIGEIELINTDGGLDYLADYALDNGYLTLSLVDDFGNVTNYLTGKVSALHENNDSVFLTVKSMYEVLDVTHKFEIYLGNNALPNGVEGVATDIKGTVKPKVFGRVTNATPILVNTEKLVYQISSRNCTVTAVYDKGGTLTLSTTYTSVANLLASMPAAGTFNRYQGYVMLGQTPTGTVTCDAESSELLAGDVINAIAYELTQLTAEDIANGINITALPSLSMDVASKTALNAAGTVGLFVNSENSAASLINQIIKSIGGYWYFNGSVIYGALLNRATVASLELLDYNRIAVERSATGAGSNGLPIRKVEIKYDKLETVQQETELAQGSVTPARKARLAVEYRKVGVEDSTVIARHPFAEVLQIDSVLKTESDATTVATRLLNLFKTRTDVVEITANVSNITAMQIGMGVLVTIPKLGYDNGVLLTVVGYQVDVKDKSLILECFL